MTLRTNALVFAFYTIPRMEMSGWNYLPHPRQEDIIDNGSPRDTAQETEGSDDDGKADDPVDVLRPEDLSRESERG